MISDACLVIIVIFALLAHSFIGYLAFAKRRGYAPSKLITSFLGVYTFVYPNLFAMPIHLRLSHYIFDAVENQQDSDAAIQIVVICFSALFMIINLVESVLMIYLFTETVDYKTRLAI